MTGDLDEADRERADHVREKRHERADPEGRVGRVQDQQRPPDAIDLPDAVDRADATDPQEPDEDLELPEPIREAFEDTRKRLTYGLEQEYGIDLDAEAHYWPLVVHVGVERVKGMWLEEVKRTMENAEGIDEPE